MSMNAYRELNELGEGRCSVPMWSGYGDPAGCCDKPAFGERPEGKTHTRYDGFEWRDDGLYAGYVPGLACPIHGGPKIRYCMDGNMWMASRHDFINLQESWAGFGETKELALANLIENEAKP
jgi:hypothetical protein